MPIWGEMELLCRAVAEEARKEAEKILSRAREEAERIIADAGERSEKEYAEESLARRSKAYAEAKHVVDAAELEARKRIMAFRDEVIREVLSALGARLKAFRNEPSYSELLTSAVREGIEHLLGREFIVELNGEDLESQRDEIVKLAAEMSVTIEMKPSSAFEGGVRVYTADRRLLYDNSLSARLVRSEDDIRQEIWRAIFGTEGRTG
jgi:vacuolar-type H+-ATPase subunit E/Vma4